jgi:hypothetical protein
LNVFFCRRQQNIFPDSLPEGMFKEIMKDLWLARISSCYQSFSPDIRPWADIAVALPVFTYGQN